MDFPQIIFEDDNFLALLKPAGWVVNDSNTAHGNPTLQDWLKDKFDFELSQLPEFRSGIVHRLDKETSGVILVAKNKKTFESLQSQFKNREVVKTYVALVHGKVKNQTGQINAPIGRLPKKRTRFGIIDSGRDALTHYQVVKNYDNYTLLELHPKTGRTHQLRVHLKHIGHSIVSDPLYAGRKTLREDKKTFPRLFLHAKSIEFTNPTTNEKLTLEAPLPSDLQIDL